MKRLCIADLQVDLNCRYETLLKQTIPYEIGADTEKTAQISVDVPDSEIEKGISKYPTLSKDDIEYVYSGGRFYRQLLDFNGMMLHASAVVKNGYAYLFSANPGTGKSTHTSLWLKVFKDDAFIINDDKPALRIIDGEIFVYGTPFSGKTDLSTNTRAKMGGICFLERSEENWIKPINGAEAIMLALRQTIHKLDEDKMPQMLDLLDKVLMNAPLYRMGCNISEDAPKLAYEEMRKAHKDA